MELELHDFDNKFKQDLPEEETSFIEPDYDQDVENYLLNYDQKVNEKVNLEEDFDFHLIGLKENMRLVDKRKRLKEYTGLDIDPKKGRFSKALLEDIEFTWRDDLGWSGILYRNKPVYRMSRGDMIPLPNERIYPQFKMAVDLARDEEEKKEEQEELETWLESRLKSIEEELPSEDLKELKNLTSVETLEEKATEYRKLKHTEEDNEEYKLLEEYALLLSDQLRIEQGLNPEEHDTLVEQKKFELLRKLKQSLIKYLPYGVLTGVITTIGYIIDYTIGSKSRIGVGAHEIKNEKDHDEKIKEIDERIEEIKKEKEKLAKEELDRKIDQEIEDHIKKVEEKINESSEEYLKRRKKERQEKLDKILNDPTTKLKETPITDSKPSDKETSITDLKPFKKEIPMTDLSLFVDQKEQESISIGKTVIILGAAIVGGAITLNFVSIPVFMVATYSAGQSTLIGYKFGWITYSLAAYGSAIFGIKIHEFLTSEAAEKLQEPIGKEVNKKTKQALKKVGTALFPVGKPALDIWYWLSKFFPQFIVNIFWLIYKIITISWNLVSTILSNPILDFFIFVYDHVAILLFCGIVFYLLFNQGSPIDLILLFIPWVLIFTMIHLGYKMKNYFYPPTEE